MRLNVDAIICDKNRKWFEGSLNGFNFYIEEEIKDKDQIKNPENFKTAAEWIEYLGYKSDAHKLTRILMKSIILRDSAHKNGSIHLDKGVLRLFIGDPRNKNHGNFKDKNVLCANCIWTCKHSKNTSIVTCKAFHNDNPK